MLRMIRTPFHPQDGLLQRFTRLRVFLRELALRQRGHDRPVGDVDDIVRALFQIGGDVRGEEDGDAVLLELGENAEELVPREGIQAAGRLVEDQDLRPVG